ncbi:tRNA glutamyl-Q(34) synthetase GluQRS [Citricoccus muralis]|uniref:Glutamyl-tRNA synthetase n=1 Tax=Citricoccus muralis TaxID=169134 RepID=A0A3D9LD79_9MICC|nr:tRNA glutamyl-Q(34) synthetase GluQRS [Citricoccus muralis]REE04318.1 glutamyl-tRNA synthetase [Citricoccus muralis]
MSAGRYAPSPSGTLHLGNLRTAILAWLYARHSDRMFLLRIEDLDRVRSGAEAQQLADLTAIGITWDAEPVRQSERIHLYEDALTALGGADGTGRADALESGLVYECYCSRRDIAEATSAPQSSAYTSAATGPGGAATVLLPPGSYPGTCRDLTASERARRRAERPAALRINAARAAGLPDGQAPVHRVTDRLNGTVEAAVDDFVLRRNDGAYAYNWAVVVDDLAQGVDQVVRGDDLLSSTPRQDWLARLLAERTGRPAPETEYVHVPLVLNAAGQRLAKRDGAVTLADLAALPASSSGGDAHGDQVPDGGWSPTRVRDLLLDSLGLPAGPLDHALAHFDPDRVPRSPWTPPLPPPQTPAGPAGTPEEKIRFHR